MANRILKIDELALPDHHYLNSNDECHYFGEYTAGAGHAHSPTNQLILNFKKGVETRNTTQWKYKLGAISSIAEMFRSVMNSDAQLTFVPVPPSKSKSDPLYDDRILKVLELISANRPYEVRELILQKESLDASHLSIKRPTPDELISNYYIDESLINPLPHHIIIFDDVITTGAHFYAVKKMLLSIYPAATIYGLFVARRVPQASCIL